MFVSVTRLHLRRWWYLPAFALHALRSRRQVRGSPGFVRGGLAGEPWLGFWTITIWADERSMKGFRNSAAHLKAMPRLSHWCDEASYVHWEQDGDAIPTAQAAFERLGSVGKLSKVRHPTAGHAAGRKTGNSAPLPPGEFGPRRLRPGAAGSLG